MSGRRFARRNLFSKLLAWLLSFHFQFSLQGEKIITLNNNLQKKKKKRVGFYRSHSDENAPFGLN